MTVYIPYPMYLPTPYSKPSRMYIKNSHNKSSKRRTSTHPRMPPCNTPPHSVYFLTRPRSHRRNRRISRRGNRRNHRRSQRSPTTLETIPIGQNIRRRRISHETFTHSVENVQLAFPRVGIVVRDVAGRVGKTLGGAIRNGRCGAVV